MEKGLVSIITPLYNGERFIGSTIESVIAQTYPHWEMWVVNDGSKDNSESIVLSFAKDEPRIHYIKQPNGGSASARNNGLRHCNGQYIALLDADDLWEPDFLSSQIQFMNEKKAQLVHCSYKRINEDGNEILMPFKSKEEVSIKNMQKTNHIACLTGLYDCSTYGKVYLKEELKSIRDDYAYWLDIVKLVGTSYGNPKVLASYRVMSNSTTGKKRKLIKSQFKFYHDYQGFNIFKSTLYTICWGILGVIKFAR